MGYSLRCITIILFLTCFAFIGYANNNADTKIIDMQEFVRGYYDSDPLPDKTIYLTFDDGPSDWTVNILDILKKENIHATFFVLNIFEKKDLNSKENHYFRYQDVLIRMVNEGHVIGNHTVDHAILSNLSPAQIAYELDTNQARLDEVLGAYARPMTLIRPPFGLPFYKPAPYAARKKVGDEIRKRGLVMMWTKLFDSNDSANWAHGEWYANGSRVNVNNTSFKNKVERIYARLTSGTDDKGAIILFHDVHLASVYALEKVIKNFKDKGYIFATLEDYVFWRWHRSSQQMLLERNGKSMGDNFTRFQEHRIIETNPLLQ